MAIFIASELHHSYSMINIEIRFMMPICSWYFPMQLNKVLAEICSNIAIFVLIN